MVKAFSFLQRNDDLCNFKEYFTSILEDRIQK